MVLLENSTTVHDEPTRYKKHTWLYQTVGLIISIICLWLTFHNIKLESLVAVYKNLYWHYALWGIASLTFGYLIRIQRWAIMLRACGTQVKTSACAAPFLGSITLNNLLPFRAGDLIRALVFPTVIGVKRTPATASLLLERLVDLLTLLMILSVGLLLGTLIKLPSWLTWIVIWSLVFSVSLSFAIFAFHTLFYKGLKRLSIYMASKRYTYREKILTTLCNFIQNLGEMFRLQVFCILLLLSMLIWIGETGLFLALMRSLEIEGGTLTAAFMVMAITTLATIIPSSPGYIGPFHIAASTAVIMIGASANQAASFALLAHLGVWLPTTLAGGVAMLFSPKLFRGIRAQS